MSIFVAELEKLPGAKGTPRLTLAAGLRLPVLHCAPSTLTAAAVDYWQVTGS
jgi:hypothetical protein